MNRAAGRLCDRVPAPPHPPPSRDALTRDCDRKPCVPASLLDSDCRHSTRAAARLARSIAAARLARRQDDFLQPEETKTTGPDRSEV